jgi:hypothetical protein
LPHAINAGQRFVGRDCAFPAIWGTSSGLWRASPYFFVPTWAGERWAQALFASTLLIRALPVRVILPSPMERFEGAHAR